MKQRIRRRHRLDKGMRGWIVDYAKRNHWRVAAWLDVEDLIQDGYVCYSKCLARYGSQLEQRHFMALVKRSFHNHIVNLANKRTITTEVTASAYARDDCEDANDVLEAAGATEPEEATLACLVRGLPRELSELVNTLLSDARELPQQPRESVNAWLCRLAGLPAARFDVESTLRHRLGLDESRPVPKAAGQMYYVEGRLFSR